uniref:Uncharacterized protein n=1 Tax=Ornithorhynchus anatinus TaxID=9258 RepID=A0A6I8PER8_ORNAN
MHLTRQSRAARRTGSLLASGSCLATTVRISSSSLPTSFRASSASAASRLQRRWRISSHCGVCGRRTGRPSTGGSAAPPPDLAPASAGLGLPAGRRGSGSSRIPPRNPQGPLGRRGRAEAGEALPASAADNDDGIS